MEHSDSCAAVFIHGEDYSVSVVYVDAVTGGNR